MKTAQPATSGKTKISHPCDIESRRPTADRKAAWHNDCPIPKTCRCPAHANDGASE